MTAAKIAVDVDRGLSLIDQIAIRLEEVKAISERLEQAALEGDQIQLTDDKRDGMQFLAEGTDSTVPIVITADSIVQSFTDGSPAHARAEAAAKEKLPQFFKKSVTWKNMSSDGKAFRQEVTGLLGDDAPAFISACVARDKDGIPKNTIKIEWPRATPNKAPAA